jgi:hypothetical protein
LLLSEHLTQLFSLSRRYRFRNMIDQRRYAGLAAAVVAQQRRPEISLSSATVRPAGNNLFNRRHFEMPPVK